MHSSIAANGISTVRAHLLPAASALADAIARRGISLPLAGRVAALAGHHAMPWPVRAVLERLAGHGGTGIPPAHSVAIRLGVLIPPANIMCEREFPHAVPPEIAVHFQRLERAEREITAESLVRMKASAGPAAQTLAYAPLTAIAYACTSGSFLSGSGIHDEIADQISETTGLPAVTTSTAALQALRALKADDIFVITPYPPDIAEQSAAFLRDNGFRVIGDYTFDCRDSAAIRGVTAGAIADQARAALRRFPETGAVFISCTNLPSFEYIARLERELGVPVVSSNSATLWAAVKVAGFAGPLPVLGTLGRTPYPLGDGAPQ